MGAAEHRLDGTMAYRSLVRYDAYGEMSGRQSTSIALLDETRSGLVLSSIHHREQARLYAKQSATVLPSSSSRPRSTRRSGWRSRATAALSAPGRLVRVGYFGPEGTFTHEALIETVTGSEPELVPLPTIYDTVMAVHGGTVDRGLVPIENSLEGSVNATLDALAMETEDVAIVGEVVHPIRQCLIARTPARARSRSRRWSRTLRPTRSARASFARGCRARACSPAARPPTRSGSSPSTTARGRRSATGWRRSATAAWSCAPGSRTLPATRPGSCGWPRAGQRGRAGADARAVEDRDRVLGCRVRVARVARQLPVRVRRARRQPDPDRVAASQAGTRALHVLRRPRGARLEPHVVEALAGLRNHVEALRVLGSFPAA